MWCVRLLAMRLLLVLSLLLFAYSFWIIKRLEFGREEEAVIKSVLGLVVVLVASVKR